MVCQICHTTGAEWRSCVGGLFLGRASFGSTLLVGLSTQGGVCHSELGWCLPRAKLLLYGISVPSCCFIVSMYAEVCAVWQALAVQSTHLFLMHEHVPCTDAAAYAVCIAALDGSSDTDTAHQLASPWGELCLPLVLGSGSCTELWGCVWASVALHVVCCALKEGRVCAHRSSCQDLEHGCGRQGSQSVQGSQRMQYDKAPN